MCRLIELPPLKLNLNWIEPAVLNSQNAILDVFGCQSDVLSILIWSGSIDSSIHAILNMRLRPAEPDDAIAVARVHVRSWQVAYRTLLPDDNLDQLRAEDRAQNYDFASLDPLNPRTIVADEEGLIYGFATTAIPHTSFYSFLLRNGKTTVIQLFSPLLKHQRLS